jgi:hypothetical protein
MRARTPLLLLAVCAGALASAQTVLAAGAPNFALRPTTYSPALPETKSYFVLDLRSGSTFTDKVRVSNVGSATGTLKLYAVDATTGQTSGTVYQSATVARHGVGRWISLSRQELTLRPGASQIVTFTVTVPPGAGAGDHVGGIVAENEQLTSSSGGRSALQIKIRHLTVAAVVVRLPGAPVADVNVTSVTASGRAGYQFLRLQMANRGNVMLRPTGTLVLEGAGGRTIARRSFDLDTLVPRTSIQYPVLLPNQALRPGPYTATVTLHYGNRVLVDGQGVGGSQTLTRTFGFNVSASDTKQVYQGAPQLTRPAAAVGAPHRSLPWSLILAWALAAAAVVGAIVVVVRRRVVR